ncbi:MAG: methyltransferase domain-containing protein [Desulfuromonadales bacterium]|jgi:protein arginine N-methyltransferase 1
MPLRLCQQMAPDFGTFERYNAICDTDSMSSMKNLLASLLNPIRKIVSQSPQLQKLIYETINRQEFNNLYEHEKMLADTMRIETYKRAIDKHITADDVVLDLGTGTGILSFFAAKKRAKKVYAIDHSNFIEIAKKVAQANHLENIQFVQTNSRSFHSERQFDFIIHEQMGDYLFNEDMIANLLDLRTRLLKPGGQILPGKFELYIEPVDLHEEFNVPFIWENDIYGIDFGFLENHYEVLDEFKSRNYRQEWIEAASVKEFLCEPEPALTFDLMTLNSEKEIPRSIRVEKTITKQGMFDGFCLYFKAIFDGEISLDTSPKSTYTHWGNCMFRIESRACSENDKISYEFSLPNLLDIRTWSVTIDKNRKRNPPIQY